MLYVQGATYIFKENRIFHERLQGGGGQVKRGVLGGNPWVGGGGVMTRSSYHLDWEVWHQKGRVEWSSLSGMLNL